MKVEGNVYLEEAVSALTLVVRSDWLEETSKPCLARFTLSVGTMESVADRSDPAALEAGPEHLCP